MAIKCMTFTPPIPGEKEAQDYFVPGRRVQGEEEERPGRGSIVKQDEDLWL
jgi:hypothetical protein